MVDATIVVESAGAPRCVLPQQAPSRGRLRSTSSNETCGLARQVAQVAQIFGRVNTLSGYVRTESVSAEFSTAASEPWLRLHVTVEE